MTAPYLSREAAEFLVARGIEHLVVDLPSIDRAHDEGRLTAHRVFFGLPPGSHASSHARDRRQRSPSSHTFRPKYPMAPTFWKYRYRR